MLSGIPGIAIRSVPADLKVPTVRTPCTLSWTLQCREEMKIEMEERSEEYVV